LRARPSVCADCFSRCSLFRMMSLLSLDLLHHRAQARRRVGDSAQSPRFAPSTHQRNGLSVRNTRALMQRPKTKALQSNTLAHPHSCCWIVARCSVFPRCTSSCGRLSFGRAPLLPCTFSNEMTIASLVLRSLSLLVCVCRACSSLFSRKGLLTREDETMLNRIYSYNSLLFDFCLKRSVRG
jgi:hypothetical protein